MLLLAALRDQQLDIGTLTAAKERDAAAIADLIVAIEQFLARSPSALMVANLTDMLAEVVQINVPGTASEHPNWRHCFRLPVEATMTSCLARRIAAVIASERSRHIVLCALRGTNRRTKSGKRSGPSVQLYDYDFVNPSGQAVVGSDECDVGQQRHRSCMPGASVLGAQMGAEDTTG